MHTTVVACVDGSAYSNGVAEYAIWAARRLAAPLTFLNVLDHAHAERPTDLSGSIGLGAQEQLLSELAELDARKGKLAMEQGRQMLDAVRNQAAGAGIPEVQIKQMHGSLVDRVTELEPDIRLLVLGKRGETADQAADHLGSNLERVIRAMHRPIFVVPMAFTAPTSILIAFDGSETTRKGVQMIAASPLFNGLPLHVVQVGDPNAQHRSVLDDAVAALRASGHDVTTTIIPGQPEAALMAYQHEHGTDLLVMGAYGHSRIRHLLVGSTTTAMIRAAAVPLLLLR
jgi:nucleotide-binding universal stress UspA family protein